MTTIIREPSVTANLLSASSMQINTEQRVLIIGQLGSVATATAGDLYTNLTSEDNVEELFGENSICASMYRNFRKENQYTQVDCIAFENDVDGAGVAATGHFYLSGGNADEAGYVTAIVGSAEDASYTVTVDFDEPSNDVAAALVTLIAADTKLPVNATSSTGQVNLACDFLSSLGNDIALKIETNVSNFVATVDPMANGDGAPLEADMEAALDKIALIRYQTIISPFTGRAMERFMDDRFNVVNNILDGVVISYICNDYSTTVSLLDDINSNSFTYFCDRLITAQDARSGSSMLEFGWGIISQFGAVRAGRRTENKNISKWVVASGTSKDSIGGMAISSLPYFNTPMVHLPLMEEGDIFGWSIAEQEVIRDSGGSMIGNNVSGNSVLLGEVLTTYKTDPSGVVDPTWKFLEYVDTASSVREYFVNNLRSRFRQHRLTNGALIAGRAMANPALITGTCTRLYEDVAELTLAQAGESYVNFFKQNLTVAIDLIAGSANIFMKMPIVTQFREIIANIQIQFTTED